jgi:hypothetical protein
MDLIADRSDQALMMHDALQRQGSTKVFFTQAKLRAVKQNKASPHALKSL